MLKSPDESEHPQKPPENSETKPQREIYKEITRVQADTLNYGDFIQDLSNILQNKGALGELVKSRPHAFGGVKENFYAYAGRMQRVPNIEEAVSLLKTAIFGEPAKIHEDGTVTIISFTVAEPSTTTVQTKFAMMRDKKDNPKYAANKKGTDELTQKLIADGGFLPEDKAAEAIYSLRKGGLISLTHPTIGSLKMDLSRPKDYEEKSQSPTAYSYNVQTTISPSTQN